MDALLARSILDDIDNLLTLVTVKIRLQICGGLPDELGIDQAEWVALSLDEQVASGTTSSNGEIELVMLPFETLTLRVFGTDYTIQLRETFPDIATTAGVQKRFDTLGYITGHLLDPRGNSVPDDNTDGARTRQAILNFQTDKTLGIDSVAGTQVKNGLTTDAGA